MSDWENKRTEETRAVETLLRQHFQQADAYRYNSVSIRVRVIDPSFEGQTIDQREERVMPLLQSLEKRVREDILMVLMLAPSEIESFHRQSLLNLEFDEPSASRL